MKEFFISLLMNLAKLFAKHSYELIKTLIKRYILLIEQQFDTQEEIDDKKAWVVEQVMANVDNWFLRLILKLVLPGLIDSIITELNSHIGHDWVNYVDKYFNAIEEKFPFLK